MAGVCTSYKGELSRHSVTVKATYTKWACYAPYTVLKKLKAWESQVVSQQNKGSFSP